jgi:hypothetical protein
VKPSPSCQDLPTAFLRTLQFGPHRLAPSKVLHDPIPSCQKAVYGIRIPGDDVGILTWKPFDPEVITCFQVELVPSKAQAHAEWQPFLRWNRQLHVNVVWPRVQVHLEIRIRRTNLIEQLVNDGRSNFRDWLPRSHPHPLSSGDRLRRHESTEPIPSLRCSSSIRKSTSDTGYIHAEPCRVEELV